MEEDGGVKAAPVSRLRRRVSVELSEDTKSPSAPSTPTKKRGGRLAAKPQLELIDEDAIQNSPKRATRKSIARDIAEVEEKPVTPARRSTRVKSSTSLVSEGEEKVLTPSRRSTRIKSNTSIVLETASVVESPRAKRAATRRNSQAGSDTEMSLTPARTRRTRKGSTSSVEIEGTSSINESATTPGRTRRTRKGSTSNVDTPAEGSQADGSKPAPLITEVISEEPESKLRKSPSKSEPGHVENRDESPSLRKSPRLKAKKDISINETVQELQETSENKEQHENTLESKEQPSNSPIKTVEVSSEKDLLSISSVNLIKNIDPAPRKQIDKNKSASDIDGSESKRRHRTKSWTTLAATPPPESSFLSDNETTKKKLKKYGKIFSDKRLSGAGDGPKEIKTHHKDEDSDVINTSKKHRKGKQNTSIVESKTDNESEKELMTDVSKKADISNESDKENLLGVAPAHNDPSAVELLFEKPPSGEITSLVFMEDSDSNTGSGGKQENEKIDVVDGEDQCVPVVLHSNKNQATSEQSVFAPAIEEVTSNTSCEPMDIDETMPENVSLTDMNKSRKNSFSNASEDNLSKSKRKSSISSDVLNNSNSVNKSVKEGHEGKQSRKSSLSMSETDSSFKSKRKSSHSISEIINKSVPANDDIASPVINNDKSLSLSKSSRKSGISIQEANSVSKESPKVSKRKSSITQDIDKSSNEDKSTLVLSQIKDISTKNNSLSNSLNPDVKDSGPVNKNLAFNYLTSTPVQQKNVEKLGIQMNTSVITPTNNNKNNSKNEISNKTRNTSKKDVSIASKSAASDSSDEESGDSEDESSRERLNNSFLEEAEDAGDDYESGDSQNEDERQYEIENEIVERGETLTSEEELSNDSDYEKDSFIVSSNEEDNELLSGSEEDLGTSDNELTMSAKSKKKFNERKEKQQKKASKEMYESRHGINASEKDDKPKKKNNRLRLDSTLLESGDDNMVPPKKNKRMRLESTMESGEEKSMTEDKPTTKVTSSVSEPEEFVHKKKKTKRLSESICNENTLNEKEITVNSDVAPADDPLIVKIKPEPKTPQKEFEISTIHFTDRADIEQVGVDENMSMMNANESEDPLQATMADNREDSDDGASISENEEIANNYDSMLKELNKENTKQIKTHDISLNLYKKAKKPKHGILDELNLTQTKKPKNKSKDSQLNEKSVKRMFKKFADTDECSSDAIDMKLLFSDDSNGSEKDNENINKVEESNERVIPLKRTEAKTDIPGSADVIDGSLNTSNNKKNKIRKSNIQAESTDDNANAEGELPFFVDTKGDLSDSEPASSKKKNKNNSVQFDTPNVIELANESDSNEAPAEVSYISNKNKKQNKKVTESASDIFNEVAKDSTAPKTPSSEKNKKKKISESQLEVAETLSIAKTPSSDIKKRLSKSNANPDDLISKPPAIETPGSKKKSKSFSEPQGKEIEVPMLELSSERKNKNKTKRADYAERKVDDLISVPPTIKTPGGKKKSKKSSESQEKAIEVPVLELTSAKTPSTENKKKNKTKQAEYEEPITYTAQNVAEKPVVQVNEKKRKRKSSGNVTIEDHALENATVQNKASVSPKLNGFAGNKNKKLKVSHSADDSLEVASEVTSNEAYSKKSKKNKNIEILEQEPQDKPNKKRKERDDDDGGKTSKILKENSWDKIHVQRLPSEILNKLEDKPRKGVLEKKKAKATSTTDFLVEETNTKRRKPSQFLEETVCLNDDDNVEVVKKKVNMKKPKVLPFLPTISISDSGFTTNFQVNVISQKMEFVAQSNEVSHFKNEYLQEKRYKKLRTYDLYKKHRNLKLSKF